MKGYVKVLTLIAIGLAILIPFASSYPDGLETVAKILNIEEAEPIWKGFMPDYTIPTIENPYLSTLAAGFFGLITVSAAAYILGNLISKQEETK
ncbi:PDGLE domain-containing protein [Candidatus Bathyarchaeota archaeon]|nr:PDGLE domain-containing protein [Candidatus Bathyarchaeota archaeon]